MQSKNRTEDGKQKMAMRPELRPSSGARPRWWLPVLALGCSSALACGPFFPNMMLVGGDEPVFTAPVARFVAEVERIKGRLKMAAPSHPVLAATNDLAETTRSADLADLRAALKKRGDEAADIERLAAAYSQAREQLIAYGSARDQWSASRTESDDDGENNKAKTPAPPFPEVPLPSGLPDEFADYFRGAIAWHRGDTNTARAEWKSLLERPAAERRCKSIWAASMLAKSWEGEEPGKAITYYSLVRALAKEGFADSLGLAASSIGWQARAHLKNQEPERAIDLYLQQLAMGDATAYQSLRFSARQALQSPPEVLDALAINPGCRAIVTAHLTSTEWPAWQGDAKATGRAESWLQSVERAGVSDMDSAEQLALAHYQVGNFDLAQRWANRSTNSPVSQWVQAKLLLRQGKVDPAAAILIRLTRMFPLSETTNSASAKLIESLYIHNGDDPVLTPGRQALGELGVLHLHRREYAQSLDALLRAGFWVDAAYVAERVLTTDEFKAYVDQNWPEAMKDAEEDKNLPEELKPGVQSQKIRYLLARRLARDARVAEARGYFPPEWLEKYDRFIQCLTAALDVQTPRDQRITNYYTAAFLIRSNGMEMIGTEVQPDFACWAGNFQEGPTWEDRATKAATSLIGASRDEMERAQIGGAGPADRWHYRAYAPPLREEAAKLQFEERLEQVKQMPRDTDETALAFYQLGKSAPTLELADIAYKLLVRRCRKTELGDAADRQRWFPRFDENGKPVVTRKPPVPAAAPPEPGP